MSFAIAYRRFKDNLKRKNFMKPAVSLYHFLRWHVTDCIKGKILFPKLLKEKKDNEIYIILTVAIGDSLYGLAYLDAVRKKYPDKKLIVYGYDNNASMLKTYKQIDELRLLPKEAHAWPWLLEDAGLLEKAHENNIFVPIPFHCKHEGTHLSLLRKYMFDVPEDSKITYHGLQKIPVTSIKDFDKIKDRVAILNPYFKYDSICNVAMYENICEELNSRGYIVFSNILPHQIPIKGSQPLACSVEEIYSIACQVPLVVSRRSGILDLLVTSGASIFSLWEYNDNNMENATLREWQCKGNITEVFANSPESIAKVPQEFSRFLDGLQ